MIFVVWKKAAAIENVQNMKIGKIAFLGMINLSLFNEIKIYAKKSHIIVQKC